MVQIATLSTGQDEGWVTDDRLGSRPWPIAADSTGWALIAPTASYRVARVGRAITRQTHSSRVTAGTEAGALTGAQIRPALHPYQVGATRIAALLRKDIFGWGGRFDVALGGSVQQVSMTPRAALEVDETVHGTAALFRTASGWVLIRRTDPLFGAAQRAASTASEADNLWGQIEERYDGLYGLPESNLPSGSATTYSYMADPAGGELLVPPWISQHLARSPRNSVGRHLKLTATRIATDVANQGATLPVEIPSRSIPQCDILADPAQTDGSAAFAVLIDANQAVVYYGSSLRASSTEAREIGRVPLPATRNSYATLENLYLAVNTQYIWVLAVNRRIVAGRPTLVYQRLDRSNNQWLAEWADLIPPSTLTWAAGDYVPRTIAMTRWPHDDELAVGITRGSATSSTLTSWLITDRAAGPRQPIIIRPGTENEVLNVADPLEVAWQYNDPGEVPQGAYRLRRRVGSTDSYYAPGTGFTVTEDYIQWRQYDGVTNAGDAGTASVSRAEAPARIGSGSNTRNDNDNGTPTANNVLVVRVVKCRVKPGQTVSTVRWRSGDDGVDRILWQAIYPAKTDGSPDFSASPTGAAEERMTTTSTWTSSHRTVSPTLTAGQVFYAVSTGYVDDITTKSVDFQVSFNGGTNWYGNLATANDQRVQFLQWEWIDEYVTDSDWVATATAATRVAQAEPNVTIPAPWAIAGGAAWELAVSTWNTDNDQSAESPPRRLLPGGASPPTISSPANGAVIGALRVTATWTVGTQSRYALWLEDSGGVAITPRTPVESATARTATVDAPRTGNYSLVLATWSSTGYRSEARVGVNIAHATALTAPSLSLSIPTVGATTTHRGYIVLSITGTFSTGYYWRAYRRIRGQADSEILLFAGRRVGVSDSHRDYTVASGVDYEYRAELVDPNGPAGPRTNTSAWVHST